MRGVYDILKIEGRKLKFGDFLVVAYVGYFIWLWNHTRKEDR